MAKRARKPRVIWRGKVIRMPVSVQARYVGTLSDYTDRMIADSRKQIDALLSEDFAKEHFAMDASIASQTRILVNALKKKYDAMFASIARDVSSEMTERLNRNSFNATKESLKDAPNLNAKSRDFTINLKHLDKQTHEILKNATHKSADFIKTIPGHFLDKVGESLYRSIAQPGNGLKDFQEFLQQHDTGTKNWVKNTAMDQTRKAYNGLNMGRMNNAGITQGEWIHSGGSQHPRELHEEADGEVFDLSVGLPIGDDGENVTPGEAPYCRCTFGPVLTDDPPEDNEEAGESEYSDDE